MSGHVRNLARNMPVLKQLILDPYSPDIFLHLWDTYGWRAEGNDIEAGHGTFKGFDHYSGKVNQAAVVNWLQPKACVFESYTDKEQEFVTQAEPYKKNCKHPLDRPENLVGMAYKVWKCNQLKQDYEQQNNFTYDLVMRTRPDMHYSSDPFTPQVLAMANRGVLLTAEAHSYDAASDLFAIGTSSALDTYSDLYCHLDELNSEGCNMNPHHASKTWFDKKFPNGGWVKYPFAIELNRCRKACEGKLWCQDCDPSKKILSNIF